MEGRVRVSVVATGMDAHTAAHPIPSKLNLVSAVGGDMASESTVSNEDADAIDGVAASMVAEAGGARAADKANAFQVTTAERANVRDDMNALEFAAAAATTPALPLANTPDVFIPPQPVSRSGVEMRSAPDPFKDAAMKNGSRPAEGETVRARPRVSSLFARVTGGGRVSRATRPEGGSEPVAERSVAPPKQPRLGGLNPEERLPASQPEEEVLDIPAFLRRQAN
jgi:cell division protein FtsZ